MQIFLYILVGLLAGAFGGIFGVGGGTIMVPLFVLWFGMTQLQAQGTSLGVMMLPVFLFAVARYYHAGNVQIKAALFVGMGFLVGAFVGAHFIQGVPDAVVKKMFGFFLIAMGVKMVFFK